MRPVNEDRDSILYTGEVKSLPHLPHGMEVVQLEGLDDRSLGWKCVYDGSSTELTHESATNISTQELCHNDCMYNIQLRIHDCVVRYKI